MTEIFTNGAGLVPVVEGYALADLGENIDTIGEGFVPAVIGAGVGRVASGGDRTIFVTIHAAVLAGFKFISKGPGYLIAGACEHSQQVVLIDATGFRSLRIESESAVLEGNIRAIVSSDDYIFVYTTSNRPDRRYLYILENASGLALVQQIQIDSDELSSWLAIEEQAEVVAYPTSVGRIELRRTSGNFEVIDSITGIGRSAVAKWFRFPSIKNPAIPPQNPPEEDQYFLYVVAEDGAVASVAEYRRDVPSLNVGESFDAYGYVNFKGAQNPIRIDERGCSVLTTGAVTPLQPITPVFRGVYKIANGFYATLWGYVNNNAFVVQQSARETGYTRNHIVGGTAEQQALVPHLFASGDIQEAFVLYTAGEEVKWELQPQSGGGIAITDYTIKLTEEQVNTFDGYIVRQVSPGFLRYSASEPLTIRQVSEELLGKVTLNQAGLGFDNTTVIRHTRLPNTDIPYQSAWYGRSTACRMEGGVLQAHAEAGRASRILAPDLSPELARGVLFYLHPFNVDVSAPLQPPEALAQADENLGRALSISVNATRFSGSAEKWDDGTFTSVGRVGIFSNDLENKVQDFLGFVEPPPDWVRSNSMAFGRSNVFNPTGTLIFITGRKGLGIAVFRVSETGVISYWKTLVFPEYAALPDGEKGNEAQFTPDGNTYVVSCGGSGTGTVQGHTFILRTTDDWETFALIQDIIKPGAPSNTPMNTMELSRDGDVLCLAAWLINEVYVFRTTDDWASYTTHLLPNPAYYPQGVASGDFMGNPISCNYDGYRIFVGTPQGSPDYGAGVVADAGSVELYQYNHVTETYDYLGPLTPPVVLAPGDQFGSCRANFGGNRLYVTSGGLVKQYVYGINEDEISLIYERDSIFTPAGSGATRFSEVDDTAVQGSSLVDNGAVLAAGALGIVTYSEAP